MLRRAITTSAKDSTVGACLDRICSNVEARRLRSAGENRVRVGLSFDRR